jgi:hypothetical protein
LNWYKKILKNIKMEKFLSCIDDDMSAFEGAVYYLFSSHNQDGVHRVEENIKLSSTSHTNQTALLKKRHQLLLSLQLTTQYVPLT